MYRRVRLRAPPHIKYLEAAGALADGRVVLQDIGERNVARVTSSTGERAYTVVVEKRGGNVIYAYSDDNGTRYRHYVGYPIISVMMLVGLLPRYKGVEEALKGIPWKILNETYKKYAIVMDHVIGEAEKKGVPREIIENYIQSMKAKLAEYRIYYDESMVRT